jgi:hypothetical protein
LTFPIRVFVPLKEEMEYIHGWLLASGKGKCDYSFEKSRSQYLFNITMQDRTEYHVVFQVVGDMGNLRTATRIAPKLMVEEPRLAILVGIAGSLDITEARLGDVAIATNVKTYYPDKVQLIDPAKHSLVKNPKKPGTAKNVVIDKRKQALDASFYRYRRDFISHERSERQAFSYLQKLKRSKALPLHAVDQKGVPPEFLNPTPEVISATVLGSEMVIDSKEYVAFVKARNEDESFDVYKQTETEEDRIEPRNRWFKSSLPIVDMESLGFFTCIDQMKSEMGEILAFSVRGISDPSSDKEKIEGDTRKDVRRIAVLNVRRRIT